MKFLASGKVKDIYEWDDHNLLFRFSDRVSAYDVKFSERIPSKGKVLCLFAEFWFEQLATMNHFVRRVSDTEIIVKKMEMIPLECVVRGYLYGSLADRHRAGSVTLPKGADTRLAAKLPGPVFDPTTKASHDIPVTRKRSIEDGLVSSEEYDWLEGESIRIYQGMSDIAVAAGFILADLKLEFGRLDGAILLGDSIGPDEYRLWPQDEHRIGHIQNAYDKQILRDWLTKAGYQEIFEGERQAGREPVAPAIPEDIIQKMTSRYISAYERITGQTI